MNDGDSALQLLLIIDYIYDWARDVFRPSIISQLAMLANPTQDKGQVHDNGFTMADTDSDVFSLGRGKQRKDIETWDAAVEEPTEVVLEEELSLIKWATYDSPLGVFRPAAQRVLSSPYSDASVLPKRMLMHYFQPYRKDAVLRSLLETQRMP